MNIPDNRKKYLDYDFVKDYDRTINAYVPNYNNMLEAILAAIPYVPSQDIRVLELGYGSGNLTVKMFEKFFKAEITGIEISAHLSAMAIQKFDSNRCRFINTLGDIKDVKIAGKYDLIVSSLFFHELQASERSNTIGLLRENLKDGGWFIVGDYMPFRIQSIRKHYVELWKSQMINSGIELKIAELEIAMHIAENWDVLKYRRVIRKNGFAQAECVWRNGLYGVISAANKVIK